MQQSTMYNVLTSMNFFKNYLIGKVFRLWKGNVRYRLYNRTRKDLSSALIYTRPDYLPGFMDINRLLFEMAQKTTYSIKKNQSSVTIDEFRDEQRAHHEKVKQSYKDKVETDIKASLVTLIDAIEDSRTLKEEDDLENTKKGKAEKKKSLVVAKENKAVRNQVLKLARMNYKSLGTFIRLIDYRVVETQVRINQEGADLIISEMDNELKKYFIQTDAYFDTNVENTALQFNTN
jgi:dynein heavy chain